MTLLTTALAVRDAVEDERLLFLRRRVMGTLAGLGTITKSIWLWGPRRTGKSTVAKRLAREAAREGFRTEVLDATGVRSFECLARTLLVRLNEHDGAPPVERFGELGAQKNTPVLFVIDEADEVAARLDQDAQQLLRSRAEYGRFRYIFVTHRDPNQLVEEVPDIASRLLGISLIQRLGMCEEDDVEEFFARLERELPLPGLGRATEGVWQAVGGHAIAVTMIAHGLAVQGRAGQADLCEVLDHQRRELVSHMATLWRDLSPGTRTLLLDPSRAIQDDDCRGEATAEGFYARATIVFPRLLREVAATPTRNASEALGCWDLYFRLTELAYEINATVKTSSRNGRGWFWSTDETRRGRAAVQLSRTEQEFDALVNHLSKLFYEAARESDPARPPEGDPMRWRIPDPHASVYAQHPGVKALRTLRNYVDHDPDARRGPEERNERHADAGRVLERLCQRARPATPEDWEAAHRKLLEEVGAALAALLTSVRNPIG